MTVELGHLRNRTDSTGWWNKIKMWIWISLDSSKTFSDHNLVDLIYQINLIKQKGASEQTN